MNILVVDDDCVDREHIRRTIAKSKPQNSITETESVDEAILCFRDQQFDVVLLDYNMPLRNGIELLIELRKQPSETSVAIVILSNSTDENLAIECIRAGAQDFISKSEITITRLHNAMSHAQIRFDLEKKLHQSYHDAKRLAEHDSLTGLANRFRFEETLKVVATNNRRGQYKVAMLLFDIDKFKFINDNYGHDVGDELLKATVNRVSSCLRGNELFARLGGDEFAIIFSNIKRDRDVSNIALRILKSMDKPFNLDGFEAKVSLSIGIAIHPDNCQQAEELFKFADIAMYRAKKQGRNQIVFFEESMQQQFLERYKIENQLTQALNNNEFFLQYQPVIDCNDFRLAGFEALIRWQIEDGIRMPDSFIGIAEKSGSIIDIGRWVIEQALAQLQCWSKNNIETSNLSISVNLSAVQLRDATLAGFISKCLKKYQISPRRVEFELTETALIGNENQHLDLINDISQMGCKIALDDFGTGFSSVSHLHTFPINTVKIDKSLMLSQKDRKTLTLIYGLTKMIQSLGLDIVAEGIEIEESAKLCKDLNIDRAQGYYFSRPISKEEVTSSYLQSLKQRDSSCDYSTRPRIKSPHQS